MKKYQPLSLTKITTYPLARRESRVSRASLAIPPVRGDSIKSFIDKLPGILAAGDLRALVKSVVNARMKDKHVILGMGAHPIKVGLSPLIIDLMKKGIITAFAANGACIVHDFELSYNGKTSENVAKELATGNFGMAEETGKYLNKAIKNGVKKGNGIGKSVGEMIASGKFKYKHESIYANAFQLSIPATVHVAIGTDIIHMHPEMDGASVGEGSFTDFKLFAAVVSGLEGGVYINLGSAVIMPEIFLKALTIARNLGHKVEKITTVNMDCIHHYRPRENVLRRPTIKKGTSYAFTGHHEIMFPLLAAAIVEELR